MKVKLIGRTSQKDIEKSLNVCAAAGKLSRMKGNVFEALDSMKDPEKALNFINRVIGMGHTSTIDHDYMVFALSEVTPIVEQTIIAERFSSFTIKSRREVDFSQVGFYVPDFHDDKGSLLKNNQELKKKYRKHMKSLFMSYSKLIDSNINKEDARFVLPYCYYGEIIMGLDATALARMIVKLTKGKCANITELKELGDKLYNIALKRAPYLKTIIDKEEVKKTREVENILAKEKMPKYTLIDRPVLLNHTNDIDKTIFTNALERIFGLDYQMASKVYENDIKGNKDIETKLMKAIFDDPDHEDLKQVNFRFQLSIPLAILTHYTRHRRLSLSIPDFVPNLNLNYYVTPPSIKSSNLASFYDEVYKKNQDVYLEFKKFKIREEDLVYFALSGNALNVTINFDGEAFRWICRLRECTKAQWCIRFAVGKMHEEVNKISTYYAQNLGPDCVTKHLCMEGKESCGRIIKILEELKEKAHE